MGIGHAGIELTVVAHGRVDDLEALKFVQNLTDHLCLLGVREISGGNGIEGAAYGCHMVGKGNVLLPNLTEAALLTGLPYRSDADPAYLAELAEGMLRFGADGIVITGIVWDGSHTGFVCKEKDGELFSYVSHRIPRSQHGTGDMFCAVCTGALALGKTLTDAAKLSAGFVEQVMKNTPASTPYGAKFEPCLPCLWKQL